MKGVPRLSYIQEGFSPMDIRPSYISVAPAFKPGDKGITKKARASAQLLLFLPSKGQLKK